MIGAEPATCMIYNNESGFTEHFPFNNLADWKILMWLIHWNTNHWVMYCANTINYTSMLLDPLSVTLSPKLAEFHGRLDRTIERLSYPMNHFSLTQVKCEHPTQQNGYDCGVFAAHFAVAYSFEPLKPVFTVPEAKKIRKDMRTAAIGYNRNKTAQRRGLQKESKKSSALVDAGLLNEMCDALEMDSKHVNDVLTRVINHIISKSEDKNKKSFIKSVAQEIRQPISNESDFISNCKLQRNYNSKPKKTFEFLLKNKVEATVLPTAEAINKHFTRKEREPFTMSCKIEFPYLEDYETNAPVTKEEVQYVYNGLSDNSPGSDNVDFSDWKAFDPEGIFLSTLFSAIIRKKMQPDAWRVFRTSLILKPGKEGESDDVGNWRPIAILDTIYRIFSKVMNRRISRWIREGNLISTVQKAIGQPDGCAEHNFILTSMEEEATRLNKSIHMVWLDLTDAFGSLPHDLIWYTLAKMGLHPDTIELFKDMYRDNKSIYQCGGVYSDQIELKQGVKQGCPLSMTLFCLSIDFLIKEMQRFNEVPKIHGHRVPVLAYADDLVLFATSHMCLQVMTDRICKLAIGSHLKFNPSKCGYFMSGTRCGLNDLIIYGEKVAVIDAANLYKYLGVPHGNPKRQSIQHIIDKSLSDYDVILKSKLTMKQKISVYKTFIAPRFIFALRTFNVPVWQLNTTFSEVPKGVEKKLGYDCQFAVNLKNALGLPKNCINDLFFTTMELGGFGITCTYDENIVQTINGVYSLFNSPDAMVSKIAREELIAVTAFRHVKALKPTLAIGFRWLKDEKLANPSSNSSATWWQRVRAALKRIKKYQYVDIDFIINGDKIDMKMKYVFGERTITREVDSKNCSNLCSFLHELIGTSYYDSWVSKKYYGALTMSISRSPHSMHIFKDKTVTDDVWRFTVLSRLNSLVISCASGRRFTETVISCRRCVGKVDADGKPFSETQCHVLQCCSFNDALITKRHDNIAQALHDMLLSLNLDSDLEVSAGEVTTTLRPDIIVRTQKHNYLIDVKSPYDGVENFERARRDNVGKYVDLAKDIQNATKRGSTVETFVIGSLGSWDPANNDLLRKLSVSEAKQTELAKKVTVSSLRDSCYIYNRHRSTRSCQSILFEKIRLEKEEEEAAALLGLVE